MQSEKIDERNCSLMVLKVRKVSLKMDLRLSWSQNKLNFYLLIFGMEDTKKLDELRNWKWI